MRLFAAIDLDDPARLAVAEVQAVIRRSLDADLRFVLPQHLHLTLVFLGEVASSQVGSIVASFARPVAQAPFEVAFDAIGAFPPRGAPRAIWIGIGGGEADIQDLQREIARRLPVGDDGEAGRFHPHLTLARFRRSRPSDRRALLNLAPLASPIRQRIDHVALYQSELSSGPPRYVQLARANLNSI